MDRHPGEGSASAAWRLYELAAASLAYEEAARKGDVGQRFRALVRLYRAHGTPLGRGARALLLWLRCATWTTVN